MLGVGGAMDLVVGARRVIVTMTATSSTGEPKVVAECTYPLTARGAADVVVTELSVFRLRDGALVLTELLGDATVDRSAPSPGVPSTSTWRIAVQPETALARVPDSALDEATRRTCIPTTSGTRLRAPKESLVVAAGVALRADRPCLRRTARWERPTQTSRDSTPASRRASGSS